MDNEIHGERERERERERGQVKLEDEGSYLSADAQEVDDVDVLADHLHHVHLRDEVDHVVVGVALLQHLDGHDAAAASGADHARNFRFHHLQIF